MNGAPWVKPAKALVRTLGRTPILGSISGVATEERAVALTFDDGPDARWTPRVLDVLRAAGAKATFFVVGEAAREHRGILERIFAEGHAIGLHGWTHRSFPMLGAAERKDELRRCAEVLGPRASALFRPPYGHQTVRSRVSVGRSGLRVVVWSAHIGDWRRQDEAVLTQRLGQALAPGGIILLHDGIRVEGGVRPAPNLQPDRGPLIAALEAVLSDRAGGYRFVTTPELLSLGPPRWSGWFRFSGDAS